MIAPNSALVPAEAARLGVRGGVIGRLLIETVARDGMAYARYSDTVRSRVAIDDRLRELLRIAWTFGMGYGFYLTDLTGAKAVQFFLAAKQTTD
jgi:hypothetical protein